MQYKTGHALGHENNDKNYLPHVYSLELDLASTLNIV
jgi:hypothetical protein